jgi:hypothetical protein
MTQLSAVKQALTTTDTQSNNDNRSVDPVRQNSENPFTFENGSEEKQ